MEVDASSLARELRGRRAVRRSLVTTLDHSDGSTWLPGDLRVVPTATLVLAALSLARTATDKR